MNPNERQDKRGQGPEETRGVIADSAPIIAAGILATGQVIAAKVGSGKDKGDGKSWQVLSRRRPTCATRWSSA